MHVNKGDVGQITGINFKGNGKFQWKVKWYHTKKETNKRCNNVARCVNVSAKFEESTYSTLLKEAEKIINTPDGEKKTELKNAFFQKRAEYGHNKTSSVAKHAWEAAERFLKLNKITDEQIRRRRLLPMERL